MRNPIDTDERSWESAETFADLVRLGERFIAGELGSFPGWGAAALDVESIPLRSRLISFHRAGLLTVASQPGVASAQDGDGKLRVQRAFVCGFASDDAARALVRLCSEPQIHVGIFRRGADRGVELPVSTRAEVPYAFAGYNAFEEELDCFSELCSSKALAALAGESYVSIVDLEWGRADRVFDLMSRALEFA
jgi:hypothetical protein